MQEDKDWQPASIGSFEISKESPYLDRELSPESNRQSYSDKLQRGYEEGFKKAEQELFEYRKSLEDILDSMLKPLKAVDDDVIHAIANLSISISKQIIRRHFSIPIKF